MPKTLIIPKNTKSWYCSNPGCKARLPDKFNGQEIPSGWTVAYIEEHGTKNIRSYYLYLCPLHRIITAGRQTNLFISFQG